LEVENKSATPYSSRETRKGLEKLKKISLLIFISLLSPFSCSGPQRELNENRKNVKKRDEECLCHVAK